ncbi:NADP-dependent oxidoreductase [Streptosporangiaceae bacterium NEAU-GS5]|nr:NADP-dependent oxidoreductase [Streptosporangiaceae bacterium NEAU-GS5]
MRAVVVRSYGGPEALEVVDVPMPEPGPGQVRVRVEGAGVNPLDLFVRSGGIQTAGLAEPREVTGIGVDIAGVVDAAGPDADGWRPGDRVVGLSVKLADDLGTYAEYAIIEASALAPAPETVPGTEAAGMPLGALTAFQALDRLALPENGTLLVTGAAGSVGGFLVQLGALRGLRVVGHAREQDEELVRGFGAAHFVPDTADLAEAVRAAVPGGVDAVVDPAGLVQPAQDAVRDGGRFVPIVMQGAPPEARGITNEEMYGHADTIQLAALSALVDTGKLALRVAACYPLEEAGAAHARLAAGGVRGKLVIVPDGSSRPDSSAA